MFTAFFGCTPKKDNSVSEAGSSERDIVFTYSCVKCTDSVMYETSDDITVVSSVDDLNKYKTKLATVYKGNIIKNLIMDCQSYTKYRPNETTGGIFVSWRRKEELPTGA